MSPTVHDYLSTHVNILVTGPAFPHREEPLQCYVPIHSSLRRNHAAATVQPVTQELLQRPLIVGGTPRRIPSSQAKDGQAVVYDKDVVYTWRLGSTLHAYEVFFWEKALEGSIGQEVLSVAIEAWLGEQHVGTCGSAIERAKASG